MLVLMSMDPRVKLNKCLLVAGIKLQLQLQSTGHLFFSDPELGIVPHVQIAPNVALHFLWQLSTHMPNVEPICKIQSERQTDVCGISK